MKDQVRHASYQSMHKHSHIPAAGTVAFIGGHGGQVWVLGVKCQVVLSWVGHEGCRTLRLPWPRRNEVIHGSYAVNMVLEAMSGKVYTTWRFGSEWLEPWLITEALCSTYLPTFVARLPWHI